MGNSLLRDIQYSNIIFDSAPIGMAIGTFDGVLLKVNQAFCDTIGYEEKEILGKKFSIFTHPDDLTVNLAQNKRIVSGEIKKHRLVKRYIHKNGKVIHGIMTVTGLVNNKGVPSYLLAQRVGITDRKEIMKIMESKRGKDTQVDLEIPNNVHLLIEEEGGILIPSPRLID